MSLWGSEDDGDGDGHRPDVENDSSADVFVTTSFAFSSSSSSSSSSGSSGEDNGSQRQQDRKGRGKEMEEQEEDMFEEADKARTVATGDSCSGGAAKGQPAPLSSSFTTYLPSTGGFSARHWAPAGLKSTIASAHWTPETKENVDIGRVGTGGTSEESSIYPLTRDISRNRSAGNESDSVFNGYNGRSTSNSSSDSGNSRGSNGDNSQSKRKRSVKRILFFPSIVAKAHRYGKSKKEKRRSQAEEAWSCEDVSYKQADDWDTVCGERNDSVRTHQSEVRDHPEYSPRPPPAGGARDSPNVHGRSPHRSAQGATPYAADFSLAPSPSPAPRESELREQRGSLGSKTSSDSCGEGSSAFAVALRSRSRAHSFTSYLSSSISDAGKAASGCDISQTHSRAMAPSSTINPSVTVGAKMDTEGVEPENGWLRRHETGNGTKRPGAIAIKGNAAAVASQSTPPPLPSFRALLPRGVNGDGVPSAVTGEKSAECSEYVSSPASDRVRGVEERDLEVSLRRGSAPPSVNLAARSAKRPVSDTSGEMRSDSSRGGGSHDHPSTRSSDQLKVVCRDPPPPEKSAAGPSPHLLTATNMSTPGISTFPSQQHIGARDPGADNFSVKADGESNDGALGRLQRKRETEEEEKAKVMQRIHTQFEQPLRQRTQLFFAEMKGYHEKLQRLNAELKDAMSDLHRTTRSSASIAYGVGNDSRGDLRGLGLSLATATPSDMTEGGNGDDGTYAQLSQDLTAAIEELKHTFSVSTQDCVVDNSRGNSGELAKALPKLTIREKVELFCRRAVSILVRAESQAVLLKLAQEQQEGQLALGSALLQSYSRRIQQERAAVKSILLHRGKNNSSSVNIQKPIQSPPSTTQRSRELCASLSVIQRAAEGLPATGQEVKDLSMAQPPRSPSTSACSESVPHAFHHISLITPSQSGQGCCNSNSGSLSITDLARTLGEEEATGTAQMGNDDSTRQLPNLHYVVHATSLCSTHQVLSALLAHKIDTLRDEWRRLVEEDGDSLPELPTVLSRNRPSTSHPESLEACIQTAPERKGAAAALTASMSSSSDGSKNNNNRKEGSQASRLKGRKQEAQVPSSGSGDVGPEEDVDNWLDKLPILKQPAALGCAPPLLPASDWDYLAQPLDTTAAANAAKFSGMLPRLPKRKHKPLSTTFSTLCACGGDSGAQQPGATVLSKGKRYMHSPDRDYERSTCTVAEQWVLQRSLSYFESCRSPQWTSTRLVSCHLVTDTAKLPLMRKRRTPSQQQMRMSHNRSMNCLNNPSGRMVEDAHRDDREWKSRGKSSKKGRKRRHRRASDKGKSALSVGESDSSSLCSSFGSHVSSCSSYSSSLAKEIEQDVLRHQYGYNQDAAEQQTGGNPAEGYYVAFVRIPTKPLLQQSTTSAASERSPPTEVAASLSVPLDIVRWRRVSPLRRRVQYLEMMGKREPTYASHSPIGGEAASENKDKSSMHMKGGGTALVQGKRAKNKQLNKAQPIKKGKNHSGNQIERMSSKASAFLSSLLPFRSSKQYQSFSDPSSSLPYYLDAVGTRLSSSSVSSASSTSAQFSSSLSPRLRSRATASSPSSSSVSSSVSSGTSSTVACLPASPYLYARVLVHERRTPLCGCRLLAIMWPFQLANNAIQSRQEISKYLQLLSAFGGGPSTPSKSSENPVLLVGGEHHTPETSSAVVGRKTSKNDFRVIRTTAHRQHEFVSEGGNSSPKSQEVNGNRAATGSRSAGSHIWVAGGFGFFDLLFESKLRVNKLSAVRWMRHADREKARLLLQAYTVLRAISAPISSLSHSVSMRCSHDRR